MPWRAAPGFDSLIRIVENHHALWLYFEDRWEVERILSPTADLAGIPTTAMEERFVQFVRNHLKLTVRAARAQFYEGPQQFGADIRAFHAPPPPRAAWERARRLRDREFIDFVERHRTGSFCSKLRRGQKELARSPNSKCSP